MKKTDRSKYIAILISVISLLTFLMGYPLIAAFTGVPAVFIISFTAHKSGNLFKVALFIATCVLGLAVDFPYEKFPATLIFLNLMAICLQIRTWFFEKLLLYKVLSLEMILMQVVTLCFVIVAIKINYNWYQWISGGIPMLLLCIFSLIIYQDRNSSRIEVSKMKVQIGRKAPDFTLNDQYGKQVSLKNILKEQHALLIFVRGDWCPTCHMMLRSYVKNKEKLLSKNVKIVGIGPDPIGVNKDIMSRIDENSLMLADEDQEIAGLYSSKLQDNNPVTKSLYKNGIPLPASFLVHQKGKIIYTSSSDKAAEILQPEKIFEVLDKI